MMPLTSYETSHFASGEAALYSNNAGQRFDNVVLVPEPTLGSLAVVGCALLAKRHRSRH